MNKEMLLELKNVCKSFSGVPVLADVNLTVCKGDTIGIIGKSGRGKTTLAKIIVGLIPCDSGRILYGGLDIAGLRGKELAALRPRLQLVFQDYRQSLPPHRKIGSILSEPLIVNQLVKKDNRDEAVFEMLDNCGLPRTVFCKYPHQLSGGEAQRVALARALGVDPDLLILDEATSGLDEETARKILALSRKRSKAEARAVLLISHDLELIENYCDSVYCLDV